MFLCVKNGIRKSRPKGITSCQRGFPTFFAKSFRKASCYKSTITHEEMVSQPRSSDRGEEETFGKWASSPTVISLRMPCLRLGKEISRKLPIPFGLGQPADRNFRLHAHNSSCCGHLATKPQKLVRKKQ